MRFLDASYFPCCCLLCHDCGFWGLVWVLSLLRGPKSQWSVDHPEGLSVKFFSPRCSPGTPSEVEGRQSRLDIRPSEKKKDERSTERKI